MKAGSIVTKSASLTNSKSALLHAVEKQQYEIAKLLLQNGASTDDGDSANGWPNSIMMTCQQKDLKMLQLLINHGAITDTPSYIERNDKHGNTYKVLVHPIFIASQSSDSSFLEVGL